MIVEDIVTKMKEALQIVTEPHKLTNSIHAVNAIVRSLASPAEKCPELATNVFPLMMAILPGIDPNDFDKTKATMGLIGNLATLIPFADASSAHKYYDDLTDNEKILCEQTGQITDFMGQYLDR